MSEETASKDSLSAEQPKGKSTDLIEVKTKLGTRSWIRKSHIVGIDECAAPRWYDSETAVEDPYVIVHTLCGKSWSLAVNLEKLVTALREDEG